MNDPLPDEPAGDHCYGIIALRRIHSSTPLPASQIPRSKDVQVLLISQKTLNPAVPSYWSFPKGHPEPQDDSPLETATRELNEETGLSVVRILFEDRDTLLERYRSFKGHVKEVRYWIGMVGGGGDPIEVQEIEVDEARFCDWDDAIALVPFERSKKTLRHVRDMLDTQNLQHS